MSTDPKLEIVLFYGFIRIRKDNTKKLYKNKQTNKSTKQI